MVIQKVRTFAFKLLVNSGFHSHVLQYMQKVHTNMCEHSLYFGSTLQFVED